LERININGRGIVITLSDSGKNTIVTDLLKQSHSVHIGSGCIIEYNMNSLVDNIVVSSNPAMTIASRQPFKKLFPVDSIIKPFRPLGAGVRYGIFNKDESFQDTYRKPSTIDYGTLNYRTYYAGADTYYKYWVSPKGGVVDITIGYPKTILTNKIIIRFELSHSTPTTWNVFRNGTQIANEAGYTIKPFLDPVTQKRNYDAGTLTLYYNGNNSWIAAEPDEPQTPVSLDSLRLTTGAVANKYIGVIEMSPRWYKDISDRISDFTISKESSSGSEDILPVGMVTANSLSMNMVSYESPREVLSFDKTLTLDPSKTYLYKQVQVMPYFKIYHSSGTYADSSGLYEKIPQGVFYCDTWDISEFGDISLNALDGAKILQETLCPEILCESYSSAAILRRLLDSIGFTNYNFNYSSTDKSVMVPIFWWTDPSKTVWDSIQELCRDSQMVACFDENNILQFYTREYLFDPDALVKWEFRNSNDGLNLANISSFTKKDLPSANTVKVIWNPVTSNASFGDGGWLWKSEPSELAALSLDKDLLDTSMEGAYMHLTPIAIVGSSQIQSYSGYVVIGSEIIEYDAVGFIYYPESGAGVSVDIKTPSDIAKFGGLAKSGSAYFKPSGKYRIKLRGAFGTKKVTHRAKAQEIINSWEGREVVWT